MSIFLLLITVAIPSAWGIFDGRGDSDGIATGIRRGDQFPITENLLQCDGDNGDPLLVGLNVTNPGDVFKPARSRYTNYLAITFALPSYIHTACCVLHECGWGGRLGRWAWMFICI